MYEYVCMTWATLEAVRAAAGAGDMLQIRELHHMREGRQRVRAQHLCAYECVWAGVRTVRKKCGGKVSFVEGDVEKDSRLQETGEEADIVRVHTCVVTGHR